jgi:glycerol-3-phosphate acyltransferase PlsY
MALSILVAALVCYLLGNHNGAICVSAILGDDVRKHGSGNAGLTNFIRNYGTSSALMVVVIDAGKAVLACVLGGLLLQPYGLGLEGRVLGGACVMLGHVFPALQGFRGGKGILSGLFVALSVDWRIALMIVIVFFTFYLLTQYVSLGSILSSLAFGIGFVVFHHNNLPVMLGGLFMSALAIFMHRGNLVRLLKGQERKTNLLSKGKKE